jgi:hypothetical protein
MASSTDHTYEALANRLIDRADGIDNPALYDMETDLRDAAAALRAAGEPTPPLQKLVAEIRHLATFSSDLDARKRLRALLGEAS